MRELELILDKFDRRYLGFEDYEWEYITFSKYDAIRVICSLIRKAKKIEIYHRPVDLKQQFYRDNKIINAINSNPLVKVDYYSNFSSEDFNNKYILFRNSDNVTYHSVSFDIPNYHHKEIVIDDKVLIFGSINFLTNTRFYSKEKGFFLENICFWLKK